MVSGNVRTSYVTTFEILTLYDECVVVAIIVLSSIDV